MTEGGPALRLTGSCRTPWQKHCQKYSEQDNLPILRTKTNERVQTWHK